MNCGFQVYSSTHPASVQENKTCLQSIIALTMGVLHLWGHVLCAENSKLLHVTKFHGTQMKTFRLAEILVNLVFTSFVKCGHIQPACDSLRDHTLVKNQPRREEERNQ
jgi:hypothetical protein